MRRPLFITIDGPNGVGKSTASAELTRVLQKGGESVLLTRQPSESNIGAFCRNAEDNMRGLPLACLVAADRYFQIDVQIRPALARGSHVVCDRYVESSLVLQRLDGVHLDVVWQINQHVLRPDLSFVLTAPPPFLERRLRERGVKLTRFERTCTHVDELRMYSEAGEFLKERGFNVVFIDASGGPEEVLERLCSAVEAGRSDTASRATSTPSGPLTVT